MSVSPQSLEGVPPAGQAAGTVLSKAATGAKFALFVLFAINLLNFFDRQFSVHWANRFARNSY